MARKMKDSGIEWIGEIPEEWNVKKIKQVLVERKEKNDPIKTKDILSLSIERGVFPYSEKVGGGNKAKDDLAAYKLAYPNDIVLNSMNIIVGAVGLSKYFGCISPVYYTLYSSKEDIDINYYNNIFQSSAFQKSLMGYGNGIMMKESNNGKLNTIRMRIPMEKLNMVQVPVPPLSEQQKISSFLDEKVTEIDNAIAKTKETIEDYKKYKQSIITEAVTKGINPRSEMRATGNIHIPFIPKRWDMKKMKYIFFIKKDIAGKEGYDVLSITQKGIKIKNISTNEGQIASNYSKYQLVEVGDFAMNHMDLLTGWVDVSKYSGVTSPDYRVFNFINPDDYDRLYYLYIMQMCYTNRIFYGLGQGVSNLGRWRLQADKFLNFTVPVPSKEEQQKITDFLDKQCSEIDNLIASKQSIISELESYKKSLIYEYVTGKKEV